MPRDVLVDPDLCIAAEICIATSPAAFALGQDDVAIILPGIASLGDDEVRAAIDGCPSGALRYADEG